MNQRNLCIKDLEDRGFRFLRHGKNHDIYRNDSLNYNISVKRHDFNENDRKYILKEADKRH